MGLEVATYISGLVATNPVGATDPKSQGDDHLRLIKSTLLASFPNINGAVTATPAQLNVLATDGAGAGMVADLAAMTDPNADRIIFWDDSASALAQLSLGTGLILTGTQLAIVSTAGILEDLAALADFGADALMGWDESANAEIHFSLISGELLTTGTTVGVGTNIPKKDAANTFSGANSFTASGSASAPPIRVGTSSDSFAIGASVLLGIAAAGAATFAIRDETNNVEGWIISGTGSVQFGTGTAHPLDFYTNNAYRFGLQTDGQILTNNVLAGEVGFKGLPTATDETPVLTDTGKMILATGNVTIPANASVAYPVGTVITVINNTASTLTIAVTSDTLRWAGTGGTDGTRTLASHQGVATLVKTSSTLWVISGNLS